MDDLNGYVFVNLRGERHPAREVNRLSAAFGLHVAFD